MNKKIFNPDHKLPKLNGVVMIDGGAIEDINTAKIPILDRGFLYGDKLIESMFANNQKIFRLSTHFKRLFDSAKQIGLKIDWLDHHLRLDLANVLSYIGNHQAFVRIVITSGYGIGINLKDNAMIARYIIAYQIKHHPLNSFDQKGTLFSKVSLKQSQGFVRLFTSKSVHSDLSKHKTGDYQAAISRFRIENITDNYHSQKELLWVDNDQKIIEAQSANVFFY